jgi:hypothetical protein
VTPCASPPPGPSIFVGLFFLGSTTLLTGMTGLSLQMQWPLTSQLHGSVSQREQLGGIFCTYAKCVAVAHANVEDRPVA